MSDIVEYPLVKMHRGIRHSDFNYKKNRIERNKKIESRNKEIKKIQKERLERRKIRQPSIDINDIGGTWDKSKLSKRIMIVLVIMIVMVAIPVWLMHRRRQRAKSVIA